MIKIIKIENCEQCPHSMEGHSAICQHHKVYKKNLEIEDFTKISSFCPLENYPNPITPSYYLGHFEWEDPNNHNKGVKFIKTYPFDIIVSSPLQDKELICPKKNTTACQYSTNTVGCKGCTPWITKT